MKENPHERALCDAVMAFHADRKGQSIQFYARPEALDRRMPSVDDLFTSPTGLIAIEHTRIESFSGQIQDDKRLIDLLAPLQKDLSGQLPTPGTYYLYVLANRVNFARGDYKKIRDAIVVWAKQKAPKLQLGSPSTAPNHLIREVPAGVPFECTLAWKPGKEKFYVARFPPPDLEAQRVHRIAGALDRKLPKLFTTKSSCGGMSVLILESNDIALSNSSAIGKAFLQAIVSRMGWISDVVYLLETEMKPWYVTVLKEGDCLFPHIDNGGPSPLQ